MSISGGGAWGGSDALNNGPQGDRASDRPGQGPARNNVNLSGGTRRDNNAPQGDRSSDAATSRQGNMAMRSSLAELQRRDRAAVSALGPDGRNVNVASDVFNDDEEGINSISEAIGRFGSWVQDKFGAGAPGGFAKSDAANAVATAAGFMVGGPVGAAITGSGHAAYSAPPGDTVGTVASVASRLGGAIPGIGGAITSIGAAGVGLVDEYVTDLDDLPVGSPATAAAQSLNSVGLDDFPGGGQNEDPRIIANTTQPAKARTSAKSAVASNVAKNKRRTFSPLNLRFAALRGVPTIEELL